MLSGSESHLLGRGKRASNLYRRQTTMLLVDLDSLGPLLCEVVRWLGRRKSGDLLKVAVIEVDCRRVRIARMYYGRDTACKEW